MDSIQNVRTNDNRVTTGTFATTDVALVNAFRRAMMSEITTYAINFVIYKTNHSPRSDEALAFRLGALPIDQTRLVIPQGQTELRVPFYAKGPLHVTTAHLRGLPFKNVHPIVQLRQDEIIDCELVVQQGKGKDHIKWRPVAQCNFWDNDSGTFDFSFKSINMMEPGEIIRQALAGIPDAVNNPPINLFARVLPPREMVPQ